MKNNNNNQNNNTTDKKIEAYRLYLRDYINTVPTANNGYKKYFKDLEELEPAMSYQEFKP